PSLLSLSLEAPTAEVTSTYTPAEGALDLSASVQSVTSTVNSAVQAVTGQAQPTPLAPAEASQPTQPIAQQVVDGLDADLDVVSAAKGRNEITLQLNPENLGSVRVRLVSLGNNEVNARFITQTPEAQDALQDQLSALKTTLESKGIRVNRLTVNMVAMATGEHNADANFQRGFNQQQNPYQEMLQQQFSGQKQHQGFQGNFASQPDAPVLGNSNSIFGGADGEDISASDHRGLRQAHEHGQISVLV
ncbi:MAG: flagellar hook-length control protein FliK, partial [Vampirovibrio sp.]|nr:flagellar hook-length control protein FliK [Vampirovibrio sp.]